jgi:hypothetical protein
MVAVYVECECGVPVGGGRNERTLNGASEMFGHAIRSSDKP